MKINLLLRLRQNKPNQTQFSSLASSRAQTPHLLPVPRQFPPRHLMQPIHPQSRTVPRPMKLVRGKTYDYAKQTQFSSSASRQWARSRQRRTSRAQTPHLLPIPRHFPSHHLRQPSHFQPRTALRPKKLVRGKTYDYAKQTQFPKT